MFKKNTDILERDTRLCEALTPESWTCCPDMSRTVLEVPGITSKSAQTETEQRVLTLLMLNEQYPSSIWTRVFTDGSATEAVKKGGSGIYITHPNGNIETHSLAAGETCTNFRAEATALLAALQIFSGLDLAAKKNCYPQ